MLQLHVHCATHR